MYPNDSYDFLKAFFMVGGDFDLKFHAYPQPVLTEHFISKSEIKIVLDQLMAKINVCIDNGDHEKLIDLSKMYNHLKNEYCL